MDYSTPDDSDFYVIPGRGEPKDACIPMFFMEAVKDGQRTNEEGRPCYKNVPFVKILVPGGKEEVVRRVREEDKQRWPRQWAAFENKGEHLVEGTLIELWPMIDKARAEELKALKILTVEALAESSDDLLEKAGPGTRELKNKALAYLEAAQLGTVVGAVEAQRQHAVTSEALAKAEARIADLEAELTELKKPATRKKVKSRAAA